MVKDKCKVNARQIVVHSRAAEELKRNLADLKRATEFIEAGEYKQIGKEFFDKLKDIEKVIFDKRLSHIASANEFVERLIECECEK